MAEKIKKYLSALVIIIFFVLITFFEGRDYLNHYKEKQDNNNEAEIIQKSISSFNLDQVRNLEEVDLFYTPYKDLLNDIVSKIDLASDKLYIEVYILTENRIKDAIIRAHKRGVDVKVLLEKNPYKAYNINNKAFEYLEKSGVKVVWGDTKDYSLNHTKMMIIDDQIIISTGNLSYSTFAYNRDFFLFIKDKILLEKLLKLFDKDYRGEEFGIYGENLVLSPNYSREKLEKLFTSATESLDIYFQYLKDDSLYEVLKTVLDNKVKVNLILSENSSEDNKSEIEELIKLGAEINLVKKPKIHSKAILVDEKVLFIGSINFSNYSLDKNREVGVLVKDKEVIDKFINIFKKDILK